MTATVRFKADWAIAGLKSEYCQEGGFSGRRIPPSRLEPNSHRRREIDMSQDTRLSNQSARESWRLLERMRHSSVNCAKHLANVGVASWRCHHNFPPRRSRGVGWSLAS